MNARIILLMVLTRPGAIATRAIATRDVHIVALARYDGGYRMYQAMLDKEPAALRLTVQVLP